MSTRKITPDFVKYLMAKGFNDDVDVSGNYWGCPVEDYGFLEEVYVERMV